MSDLIVYIGYNYWHENEEYRKDVYWNSITGEIKVIKVLSTEKFYPGDARENRVELRRRLKTLLGCNVYPENLYGLLQSCKNGFNIYTLCEYINKIEHIDKNKYILSIENTCIATYLQYESDIKYVVACNKDGIIYVDNDNRVVYKSYITDRRMHNKLLDGYLLNYVSKSFNTMLKKYNISGISIADLYYDGKLYNFIGKDISELVTYLNTWELNSGSEGIIGKVYKPKIQKYENGDVSFICEISILQRNRTWEETFKLLQRYRIQINKLLFEAVEEDKKFKMLDIPITYFKIDNVTFTRDYFVVGIIGIKSEILKQVEDYNKEEEIEKGMSTAKSSSLLNAINNMTI